MSYRPRERELEAQRIRVAREPRYQRMMSRRLDEAMERAARLRIRLERLRDELQAAEMEVAACRDVLQRPRAFGGQ